MSTSRERIHAEWSEMIVLASQLMDRMEIVLLYKSSLVGKPGKEMEIQQANRVINRLKASIEYLREQCEQRARLLQTPNPLARRLF